MQIKISDIEVELISSMGSDTDVARAARVSFDKFTEVDPIKDEKLIKFLAEHNHWSPFGHCILKFRIKAPIFVARQLVKHQVGLCWNEVSRRYVKDNLEFYFSSAWRKMAENVKQGSSDETLLFSFDNIELIKPSVEAYWKLISSGVCTEQARMVLPLNLMTKWIWTGSLYAFARVCNLRLDTHTQYETRIVAEKLSTLVSECFPISHKYLIKKF